MMRNCKQALWTSVVAGVFLFAGISGVPVQAQDSSTSTPKAQLPADQRAFKAATATVEPEQRLTALRKFVKDYPKSSRATTAQNKILATLLKNFPDRTAEIGAQAKLLVKKSGKNGGKWNVDAGAADDMANAGTNGVDLPQAEKWAKDAVDHDTEAAYDKGLLAAYKKFKAPAPTKEEQHHSFAEGRTYYLAALANVYLREGKTDQATPLLNEAYGLDPAIDEVSALRGEIALQQHHDAEALDDFERAQLLGDLRAPLRLKLDELYRQAHGGSDAGLQADLDARYATLYPATFTPAKPTAVTGGHTVLVELFTGSACPPCVAADLAADDLLDAYPRSEVVALSFDQHIPEPDPLANPDSVARAKEYDVNGTPALVVDGGKPDLGGNGREGTEKFYKKLAKAVDAQATQSTGVTLQLTASRGADGQVHAQANVTVGDADAVKAKPAMATPAQDSAVKADANKKKPAAAPVPAPAPVAVAGPPKLVVNFALVEDDIRYSGENGIRFHREVVRALAKDADSGFPLALGKTATADASFDPAAISAKLSDYLNQYEQSNDRFGQIKFISKNTAMQPDHLAVAAWVQDTVTNRVLQSAIVPVSALQTPPAGGN